VVDAHQKMKIHNFAARVRRSFSPFISKPLTAARFLVPGVAALSIAMLALSDNVPLSGLNAVPRTKANSIYADLSAGDLTFNITASSAGLITSNDNWSSVPSVEGYEGRNITATHGVDPQTVLNTEFANDQLPNSPTNVAANKQNPSAFNAGGLAEFDAGNYLAIGFQGNVQANPYMVFYLNTTGRYFVKMSYTVQDIDSGSNNAVSPVALQYRVGETGQFTNIPGGYITDATQGPNIGGMTTTLNVMLPAAVQNQPKVQVRVITTNAANSSGSSTPDEWVGVNNVVFTSSSSPTAAGVSVGGRVRDANGQAIRGAAVRLTDMTGTVWTTVSNSFGFYNFPQITAGATYTVEAASKRYTFTPSTRVISVGDAINDLDFIADYR
jgi:hypothetical protein